MLKITDQGWISSAKIQPSPHFHLRTQPVQLCVLHSIALPPLNPQLDITVDFLCGKLNSISDDSYYKSIQNLKVSAHIVIGRGGEIVQLVSFNNCAWHAGFSFFKGKSACNDFSLGIEIVGSEWLPFSLAQYQVLSELLPFLQKEFSLTKDHFVRHRDISPGRKTDPGCLDWKLVKSYLHEPEKA